MTKFPHPLEAALGALILLVLLLGLYSAVQWVQQ